MTVVTHLKSLQALDLAVRTSSLKRTGEMLGLTPAAAGQRIKALEDFLGVELLVRGRAGVRPTPELRAALPHLERGFAELAAAARALDLQRGRELHIAAPSDFVDLWLKPRLPSFTAEHPNILFCINGEGSAPLRLARVDCRIEFGPVAQDDDVETLFGDLVVPVCSPAIRDRTAQLPVESRLEGFPLLHLDLYRNDPTSPSWPSWIAANRVLRSAPERGIRFQRIAPALDAVLADAGVALCGVALLIDALEAGSVALPYTASSGAQTAYVYAAHFAGTEGRPHLRRFRDWLGAQAVATADWLRRSTAS